MSSPELIQEIDEFLKVNRENYLGFLADLRAELAQIKNRYDANRLIYSVYSRSDKQRGDEIKKPQRIAEKLERWRADAKTSGARQPKIFDIHDLIGLTIVVNFPSDTGAIADLLESDGVFKAFKVSDRANKLTDGYHAVHLKIGCSTIKYPGVLAEIQIKTMLHDGWGAKTHDLTYAPKGRINKDLLKHMEILGDVLRQLDDQSELIKNAIKIKWEIDRKRREAAQRALVYQIREHGGSVADEIIEISSELEAKKDLYGRADFESVEMRQMWDKIQNLISKTSVTYEVCRIMTYFATLRVNGDMNAHALNNIDEYINSLTDDLSKREGVMFRSLAQYALGNFEGAVTDARRAVTISGKIGDQKKIMGSKANLAYFISEQAFGMPKRQEELIGEAMRLSAEALSNLDEDFVRDTRGAILIAFGENESDVRTGLGMCRDAFDKVPNDKKHIAEAFYGLHERRAFRRLLEWD